MRPGNSQPEAPLAKAGGVFLVRSVRISNQDTTSVCALYPLATGDVKLCKHFP